MFDKFIGIPFVSEGRSFSGCDCYGLVKLFYKEELGISLPEYYSDAMDCEKVSSIIIEQQKKPTWLKLDKPVENCLIVMRFNYHAINHVGLYVGENKFLHTREKTGSCITSINSPAWKRCIEGYYIYNSEVE